MTLRERNNTTGGWKTRGKAPRNSRPPRPIVGNNYRIIRCHFFLMASNNSWIPRNSDLGRIWVNGFNSLKFYFFLFPLKEILIRDKRGRSSIDSF
jgi:hypothetical protein